MNRPDTDPTARAARDLFERASDRLDLATANRLRLMRRDALAAPAARRPWLPTAAALAGVALFTVLWWRPTGAPSTPPPAQSSATAAVPALDGDAVSDEDAELYAWLGDAPVAPDDKAGSL